jgi:hypothetical protein
MTHASFVRLAALLSGFGLALMGAARDSAAAGDSDAAAAADSTYTWSAELVDFDRDSNTVTVKARVVEPPEKLDLAILRAGDRAMLTWSGLSTAAGIRALERGAKSSYDRMTLPVEFVSSELEGRYVSFKVSVPSEGSEAISKLHPGEWVTATSPPRPKDASEAVRSIRPYVNGR